MFQLYLLFICIFVQQTNSKEIFSASKSRYRIFSPKDEQGGNLFCFYKSKKEACGQTPSFGPDEYEQFKAKASGNSVQINIAEDIELTSSLLIGNMNSKTVTVSGKQISGSLFIDQNYQLIDNSGVLKNANVTIGGSYSNTKSIGFLSIANNVQDHPKSITIKLSDFPTDIQTEPSAGDFYSGPSMTATAEPSSVDSVGGKFNITTSYFGGGLHWKGVFISTTQMFCYCPSGCSGCKYPQITSLDSNSPLLNSNTTVVLIQLPDTTGMTVNIENIDRKRGYIFQGDNHNELTLSFDNPDHISEIPSLTFSNLILKFQTSNSSVQKISIHNTNVTLNKATIAEPWTNKVSIDNAKADIYSLDSVLNNNQDLVISLNSSEINLEPDRSTFDDVNISKPIPKATFLTSNDHIVYSDSLGANITMKPSSDSGNQQIDVNILNDNSKLRLSSYKSVKINLPDSGNFQNNQLQVEDFNNLEINGSKPVSIDSLHLNGEKTRSAQVKSNVPLHLNEVVFEDEQSKMPKELSMQNGQAADADTVYVGKENSDLLTNLKMNKELTLESHSDLKCNNCSFDPQLSYFVITGKVVPPPELKLSKDSVDSFNPKSISIFVNSKNDDKSARYNITNKKYYPLVSQLDQQRCESVLKSIVDLPADMAVRCKNGVLELNTGPIYDFYDGEHYSAGQIVGMVFASIIVTTCAYLVFIYI